MRDRFQTAFPDADGQIPDVGGSFPRSGERDVRKSRGIRALLLGGMLLLALGCQPQIGDDCIRDRDCSQLGDRICDTTQPGGYCTQFNCNPTNCPQDESVCVAFGNRPSSVPGCDNTGRPSPYVRNFCMKTCSKDDDCRDGYVCLDLNEENRWGADVIEDKPKRTTVCVFPESAAPIEDDRNNQVCTADGAGGALAEGGAGGASSSEEAGGASN